jgi:hypothetical protein
MDYTTIGLIAACAANAAALVALAVRTADLGSELADSRAAQAALSRSYASLGDYVRSVEDKLGINSFIVERRPANNGQIFRLDGKLKLLAKAAGFEYKAGHETEAFVRTKKGRA